MSDEGTIKKVAQPTYYVENTVRRVGTRLHRARSATRHRFKIFLGERRILRNKKLPLTEAQFMLHEKRILELMLAGKVALHTPDGTRIHANPDGSRVYRRADGALKVVVESEAAHEETVPEERAPVEEAPSEEAPVEEEEEEEEEVEEEVEEDDDLTNLPSIGASRANKLRAAGLGNFAAISKAEPALIVKILGITEEVATTVVAAAKK